MSGKMGDANGLSVSLLKPNFSSAGWPWRRSVSVSFETGNDDQSGVDGKLPCSRQLASATKLQPWKTSPSTQLTKAA